MHKFTRDLRLRRIDKEITKAKNERRLKEAFELKIKYADELFRQRSDLLVEKSGYLDAADGGRNLASASHEKSSNAAGGWVYPGNRRIGDIEKDVQCYSAMIDTLQCYQ